MKCPHCLIAFHETWSENALLVGVVYHPDAQANWVVKHTICPSCNRRTIKLQARARDYDKKVLWEIMAWPRGIARAPLPPEVPQALADDYREACIVLADSPKASAALSRRCLQRLLREYAEVKPADLAQEIEEVLERLPTHLAQAVDAVRNIGNFAAHPNKSTNTGEILDVEPGEAEWTLDVLESLFDFYFVQPAQLAAKREALNKKLAETGKPPMK